MSKHYKKPIAISGGLFLGLMLVIQRIISREKTINRSASQPKKLTKYGLSPLVIASLPITSREARGGLMEPMNLVLIGSLLDIRKSFVDAGWYEAVAVTPWSLIKAQIALIFGGQYLHGPVTPLFVGKQVHKLAFQKPTDDNKFSQRHHLRIWATDHLDAKGQPIWIVQSSFDRSIKTMGSLIRVPVHEIDPAIDVERDLVAADLELVGGHNLGYIDMQPATKAKNAFGDAYETDGRLVVMEL